MAGSHYVQLPVPVAGESPSAGIYNLLLKHCDFTANGERDSTGHCELGA